MKTIKYIEVKKSALLKEKKAVLEGKNVLTRIIDLKGVSWRDFTAFYNINGFYYV